MTKKIKIEGINAAIAESQSSTKLAIIIPGFLDTMDYLHLIALANDLEKVGYDTIRFEPTGTWGSVGSIKDYKISQYLKDIGTVLRYATPKKNYQKIVLLGHSFGGTMAILGAQKYLEATAAVALMSPYAYNKIDFPEAVKKWDKNVSRERITERDLPEDQTKFREFAVPYSFIEDAANFDAREAAKNLNKPLLLIAGELDTTAPPAHIQKIYDAATEPKKYIILKKVAHSYRHNPEHIKLVNKTVTDWLEKYE